MPIHQENPEAPAPPGASSPEAAERGAPRLRLRLTPYQVADTRGVRLVHRPDRGTDLGAASVDPRHKRVLGAAALHRSAAVWAIWAALKRSWRDTDLFEEVSLWDDLIRVERHEPRRAAPLEWEANPYWVRAALHTKGGPVPNYLTLSGGGREVELGAFLTPVERVELKNWLERELRQSPA